MKVKVIGKALILSTILHTAEIVTLNKFHPSALVKRNEKDEPVFAIGIDKGAAISKFGVTFNDTDSNGYAQLTMVIPDHVKSEDRQAWVLDTYGLALNELSAFESVVCERYNGLKTTFDTVAESITVE